MLICSRATLLLYDSEIERTTCRNKIERRTMGDNPWRTLRDNFTPSKDITTSIVNPPMQTTNFELKPSLIQMVRNSTMFKGASTEDHNAHPKNFVRVEYSITCNSVTVEPIRMRLDSLFISCITTRDQLKQKFLNKYFLPKKAAKSWAEIANFAQFEQDSLHEEWEILQDKLWSSSRHGFEMWKILEIMYK